MTTFWLGVGLLGQAAFSGRFLMQWLASERAGRSVIPFSFWLLSLVGSSLLLIYAIYRRDPVFILGQATGFAIYIRNVVLIRRQLPRTPRAEGSGA
ncbi:MAG TPA: lipid-A-disaccharide synthase N-terminal domain-containing protein [Gemmatimonadaceae bacterium]|nr:lipid-A-disaccharide synthase N-terminal domain-containing protein [Gemmatimonadaceae bacterium]